MVSKIASKIQDFKYKVPPGEKITVNSDNSLNVPNNPIIPFIEGDGIGVDITPPMQKVVDAAVNKAYGGARKIAWMEVYAGEKATKMYDANTWQRFDLATEPDTLMRKEN